MFELFRLEILLASVLISHAASRLCFRAFVVQHRQPRCRRRTIPVFHSNIQALFPGESDGSSCREALPFYGFQNHTLVVLGLYRAFLHKRKNGVKPVTSIKARD
jgi:hypothetical protein